MFMGEYNHTIDAKSRIIVPSRLRESLGDTFVVTLGLEGCLFVYPNDEWNRFVGELMKLPGTKEARQLQRFFMAGAAECEVDKQGRILIPAKLKEHAALEKDVVFLGMMNKIEIWSRDRYEANNTFDGVDEIADRMADYGISF